MRRRLVLHITCGADQHLNIIIVLSKNIGKQDGDLVDVLSDLMIRVSKDHGDPFPFTLP